MFKNPGEKIKNFAKVIFVLGCIAIFFGSISCWALTEYDSMFILRGFIVLIAGGFSTYSSSLLIYGFGELIEINNYISEDIYELRKKYVKKQSKKSAVSSDKDYLKNPYVSEKSEETPAESDPQKCESNEEI